MNIYYFFVGDYNPDIHHRKSIRLKGYDYSSQGLYFITLCVNKNICLFGEILDGEHKIFESGKMIEKYWLELENKYSNIVLHDHVVMPNHFHGIIEIKNVGADLRVCPVSKQISDSKQISGSTHRSTPTGGKYMYNPDTISSMMQWFKTMTTNAYIKNVKENNWEAFYRKLWHRNYHEHIIRNEDGYSQISDYITSNPQKWNEDKFYVTQI